MKQGLRHTIGQPLFTILFRRKQLVADGCLIMLNATAAHLTLKSMEKIGIDDTIKVRCKAKRDLFQGFTIGKEYTAEFWWPMFAGRAGYNIINDYGEEEFFRVKDLHLYFDVIEGNAPVSITIGTIEL